MPEGGRKMSDYIMILKSYDSSIEEKSTVKDKKLYTYARMYIYIYLSTHTERERERGSAKISGT